MFHTGNHDTGFHDPWEALKKSDSRNWNPLSFISKKLVGPCWSTSALPTIVAWLFFFHILQKTSRSGANLLLPLLGTAVSTSASFDSWIYGWSFFHWLLYQLRTQAWDQKTRWNVHILRTKDGVTMWMCYLSCLTAVATLAISKPTYEAPHILHHYSREDLRVTGVGCLFLRSSRAQVCCRIPTFCTQDKTLGVDSVIKQHWMWPNATAEKRGA